MADLASQTSNIRSETIQPHAFYNLPSTYPSQSMIQAPHYPMAYYTFLGAPMTPPGQFYGQHSNWLIPTYGPSISINPPGASLEGQNNGALRVVTRHDASLLRSATPEALYNQADTGLSSNHLGQDEVYRDMDAITDGEECCDDLLKSMYTRDTAGPSPAPQERSSPASSSEAIQQVPDDTHTDSRSPPPADRPGHSVSDSEPSLSVSSVRAPTPEPADVPGMIPCPILSASGQICGILLPEGRAAGVSGHFRKFHTALWKHEPTDTKTCPLCSRKMTRSNLFRHFATAHLLQGLGDHEQLTVRGTVKVQVRKPVHHCSDRDCDAAYSRIDRLNLHMKRKHGAR